MFRKKKSYNMEDSGGVGHYKKKEDTEGTNGNNSQDNKDIPFAAYTVESEETKLEGMKNKAYEASKNLEGKENEAYTFDDSAETIPMEETTPRNSITMENGNGDIAEKKERQDVDDAEIKIVVQNGLKSSEPSSLQISAAVSLESLGPEGDEDVTLVYARHEKIPMKNFSHEARASMDVERFIRKTTLYLDLNEILTDNILNVMFNGLLEKDEPGTSTAEAMSGVFTHDNGTTTKVRKLAKTIQGTTNTYNGSYEYDQSWVCILCTLPTLLTRHVAIARLRHPANMGRSMQDVKFIILVVAPTKEKGTKNALETGRTFATLFSDVDFRQKLIACNSEEDFKKLLWERSKELSEIQHEAHEMKKKGEKKEESDPYYDTSKCIFGRGIYADLRRRLAVYISDYKDGILGHRTIQKTISTTIFLYFACILPSIAFGMLNDNNTDGAIDVKKVIYSQTIGGLCFALFGGQPLTIMLTTAPLALYTKVIYTISKDWKLNFFAMYAATGLWNMFFLMVYAFFDASVCMKWSTRSTEEIFALFISIAFTLDAVKDIVHDFDVNYHTPACNEDSIKEALSNLTTTVGTMTTEVYNATAETTEETFSECLRENSILFLLLTLGTLWLGVTLFNFTKTPYLNAAKREILADYALPVAVLIMSFFGSYVFRAIQLSPFNYNDGEVFTIAPLELLPWPAIFGSMGLGFCLSLLFFMDQNISSAMVNSPMNKLKKGQAYHWDLLVVGFMNGFLTLFGMPMVHGALPHSPLHVKALADVEESIEQGHVHQKIVYVRETRLTGVLSHILIGLSLFLLPTPMSYIPRPVLDGLFLYLAVTALSGNQMFDRVLLLFTEQAAYPPNHYVRSVPQRKVHFFTGTQLIQLAVMCGIGFSPLPYLKMTFPILIFLLLPIRHKVIPLLIEKKYLDALDGH